MILVGLVALLFRQTNIFWIAVFPAGLVVINVLSAGNSPKSDLKGQKRLDYTTVLSKSRNGEGLYDPFVGEANLEGKLHQMCLLVSAAHIRPDYAKTVLSIGAATAANFSQVLRALIPYGVLLTLFGAFVAWNGGVVLGSRGFLSGQSLIYADLSVQVTSQITLPRCTYPRCYTSGHTCYSSPSHSCTPMPLGCLSQRTYCPYFCNSTQQISRKAPPITLL